MSEEYDPVCEPAASIQAAIQAGVKRPQDDLAGGPASKKAHIDSDDTVQVKVLIPASAVGAIIGKGGETMRNLKNETGCRVQMSKNQEVYHGTNERICMVKGRLNSVMVVMEAIIGKIREKVDPNQISDAYDHKGTSRITEMKLVMPNTSAGMVIGKAGASIKEIRESTNCQIQVFPKAGSPEAKTSLERVVTVAHEEHDLLMNAVARVLEKVAADPQHAVPVDTKDSDNFSNMFSGGNTGYAGFGATGGNATAYNSDGYSAAGYGQAWGGDSSYGTPNKSYGNGSESFKYNPMQGLGNNELMSFLDSLQSTLRTSGFNEASVAEVMQAMQVLAKYNIMGLGLGLGVAAMAQMRSGGDAGGMGGYGGMENHGAAGFGSAMHEQQQQQQQQQSILLEMSSGKMPMSGSLPGQSNFAAGVIKEIPKGPGHIELEVPDTIVGAVLGPKAKTLQEIQQYSGCKVEVHKRNANPDLPAGTRLITMTGDDENMRQARIMIERVINEEQNRRQSGGAPHPRVYM